MWTYDGGHVVVGDIRSRHQKRFFWDSEDVFKIRTEEAPEGMELPRNKFVLHRYKARSGHPSRAGVVILRHFDGTVCSGCGEVAKNHLRRPLIRRALPYLKHIIQKERAL